MHRDGYDFPRLRQNQRGGRNEQSRYDTAQACLNGHVVTYMLTTAPERASKFCAECGEPTITECQNCQAPIRGRYIVPNVVSFSYDYSPPKNCHACGAKFPWTERRLAAAVALTDELNLTDEEKQTIKDKLPDVAQDTPAAKASAQILKRLFKKAEVAGSVVVGTLRELVLDYAAKTTAEIMTRP